jgi:NTE family protein
MLGNKRSRLYFVLVLFVFVVSSCAPTKEVIAPPKKPAKIALVLGAGASKGFAHVGVLKVLETNKIPIHMVVGTSVGSFVGSLYAYGYNAYQLQKMAMSLEKSDLIDLTIPDNGFIKGELLANYVNKMVNNTPLEKFRIPFYPVATNILTGQEVVFASGNAGTAVRASCSIPGIFRPAKIAGQLYVDGGVVSPVAINAARRLGADVVIAVDISSDLDKDIPDNTIETILKSINIMYSKVAENQLSNADVIIRPNVGFIGSADFEKRHEAIMEGEKAALKALPEITAIVEKLKSEGRL